MFSLRPLLTRPTVGSLGKVSRTLVATRIIFQHSPTPVQSTSPCPTTPFTTSSVASSPDAHRADPVDEEEPEAVIPLRAVKGKSTRNSVRHFVDWKAVTVYGGDGGDGSLSLCSLYANEFAGNCQQLLKSNELN